MKYLLLALAIAFIIFLILLPEKPCKPQFETVYPNYKIEVCI